MAGIGVPAGWAGGGPSRPAHLLPEGAPHVRARPPAAPAQHHQGHSARDTAALRLSQVRASSRKIYVKYLRYFDTDPDSRIRTSG
jgi:hypothetical protein